jgi:hypothetical protein
LGERAQTELAPDKKSAVRTISEYVSVFMVVPPNRDNTPEALLDYDGIQESIIAYWE